MSLYHDRIRAIMREFSDCDHLDILVVGDKDETSEVKSSDGTFRIEFASGSDKIEHIEQRMAWKW